VALPEPVRSRVVALAATALGAMAPEEVPPPLRKVARFTPAKRARLGAADLLTAVEGDPVFRQRVVATARKADADAVVLAVLERTEGWEEQVGAAAEAHARHRGEGDPHEEVHRLPAHLDTARAAARAELEHARAEARAAKDELTAVRRKVRDLGSRLGRAEQAQATAEAALADLRAERDAALAARDAEVRRAQDRPADALAGEYAPSGFADRPQGRDVDDPVRLDALLAVPTTHVLVDGYNVTKGGYGELTLEAQRTRLLAGLGGLAARTGAEVTVVFDGAERTLATALKAPRGVRLLFSRRGETADEVLRRLVRHEPVGRPVVVVSSDREVADGISEAGATAVPSAALLRLLERSVGGGS